MAISREDDKWLTDMFGERTRDITPAGAVFEATVFYAPFSLDAETSRRCASILSSGERLTSSRFITDAGKAEFIFRRAFRRYCARKASGMNIPLSELRFC